MLWYAKLYNVTAFLLIKRWNQSFFIEVGDLKKEGSFTVYSQQGEVSKADTIEELLEKILNNATIY